MVCFVNDNIIIIVSGEGAKNLIILSVERLNRDKQVINSIHWALLSHPKFAEVCILQHTPIGHLCLYENLFTVCNK